MTVRELANKYQYIKNLNINTYDECVGYNLNVTDDKEYSHSLSLDEFFHLTLNVILRFDIFWTVLFNKLSILFEE